MLAAAVVGLAAPAAAHGAEYRYWSYWQLDGDAWTYATTGPASNRPADGDVEGWRFTAGRERDAAKPRTLPDFERVCAGSKIRDGYKRVALVLDYGTAKDAPAGDSLPRRKPVTSCIVAQDDATSLDVLNRHARTRSATNGLLCAIDGYPASGCAAAANTTASSPRAGSSSAEPGGGSGRGGASTAVAVLAGLAIGGALVAAMIARRRHENR